MAKSPYAKAARRDFRVAVKPQLQAIRRQRRQTKQDAAQAQDRVSQIWDAFNQQVKAIPGQYGAQTAGIAPALTANIGSLGSMLNTSMGTVPASEQAAGAANVGAIGAGALEQIAGQQQNMGDYLASSRLQGAAQGATTASQYNSDLQNQLQSLGQQRTDVLAQGRDYITQRMDELKQQALAQALANKQLGLSASSNNLGWAQFNYGKSQDAANNALMDSIIEYVRDHPNAKSLLKLLGGA